ncbi:hypothetical protein SCLCIDRAFT_922017 [Scleroderma citrinum Foug A]|uniref:Uncharacterized protein n=1 Tax=Scleroderma citrinum Foug A TaxID=1036808 RepID=A0A0C3D1J3_9AGAM|nr:hypothetical protein SCLCIDRAFT_922017 [Scleroderma citrinum Foug A]
MITGPPPRVRAVSHLQHPDSYHWKTALGRLPIRNCIAFVTPRFQAPLANIFLLTLFRSKIIQSIDFSSSFPRALERDSELGAHTDIMHFSFDRSSPPITSMTCDKYVWWNANTRPYGHDIPFLCPACASVRPWGRTVKKEGSWIIQCSNPDCGLNADKSRFRPRATVSGEKSGDVTFITPTNKRTSGWFSFRVVDLKATLV